MTSPKPQAKTNLIHQQILAGLLKTTPGTRNHKVWDRSLNDGKGDVVTSTVSVIVAPTGLAANVSDHRINAMAARWIR